MIALENFLQIDFRYGGVTELASPETLTDHVMIAYNIYRPKVSTESKAGFGILGNLGTLGILI